MLSSATWLALSCAIALSGDAQSRADDSPRQSSIWFVSWQHTGHIKPLCPIALDLQARGWTVRIAVHDEVSHQVPSGLPVESVGSLPWTWEEELDFRRSLWDPSPEPQADVDPREAGERKAELSEKYFAGSQGSLASGLNASLQRLPRSQWPALIAVDVSSVGAMDVAELLGIPFAVVSGWPVGPTLQSIADPSAFSHHWLPSELFAFPQSAEQQGFMDRFKRVAYTTLLPRFMGFMGFHAPRRALRRELGLSDSLELLEVPKLPPRGERPLVVVLSHWGLDRPRPVPSNVVLVGPVENYPALAATRASLDASVQSWLAAKETKIVYISFGTNVQLKPRLVREMLAAIAKMAESAADVRFLWDANESEVEAMSTAATKVAEEEHEVETDWPLSNVLFAPRVDQLAVLASGHLGAFVSHCGLNSVHEAMHFGVPIIAVPFLGDQLITAFLIAEAGAGVRLSVPRFSASAFQDAVRSVTSEAHFQHAAARIGGLGSRAGGSRAAADALESVALFGSSHMQTIGDMHPGSDCMWDVRLAILVLPVCVALVLYWSALVFSGAHEQETEAAMPRSESGASAGKKKRS